MFLKLTFEMLIVRGKHHSFSTHERCSCKTVKGFETQNVSTCGGLESPNFGFMPNALASWAIRARHLLFQVFEHWLWGYRYFLSKVNIWSVNCVRAKHSFSPRERCSCESVKVFETENVSTWRGLELPTFRFMPNALTIWAIRARHLLSHVFEHWLWDIDIFDVKLIFEILTVRGQQHSF